MHLPLLIFLMLHSITCAQSEYFTIQDSIISRVITNDSTVSFYKKRMIPHQIRKIIKAKYGVHFRIVNPGNPYNSTDVLSSPFLPNRQLLFGGICGNYCFFVYKKGGRGNSTYFTFYNTKTEELNIYNISNKTETLDDLVRVVSKKEYYPIKL